MSPSKPASKSNERQHAVGPGSRESRNEGNLDDVGRGGNERPPRVRRLRGGGENTRRAAEKCVPKRRGCVLREESAGGVVSHAYTSSSRFARGQHRKHKRADRPGCQPGGRSKPKLVRGNRARVCFAKERHVMVLGRKLTRESWSWRHHGQADTRDRRRDRRRAERALRFDVHLRRWCSRRFVLVLGAKLAIPARVRRVVDKQVGTHRSVWDYNAPSQVHVLRDEDESTGIRRRPVREFVWCVSS